MDKRPTKDAFIVCCAVEVLIVWFALLSNWNTHTNGNETERLYEAVLVTDSSFHVNLSENSCLLVEIADDTMTVHTNNADKVGYKQETNSVFVFCHETDGSFSVREYSIDSILGTRPKEIEFDNH